MKPPEVVKKELVEKWKAKAQDDLEAARILIASPKPLAGIVGFLCQQAVEKYIKAFLIHRDLKFAKTHDISVLVNLVNSIEPSLADKLRPAIILSEYSVEARYPGDLPPLTLAEASVAVELASRAQEVILSAMV